MPAPEMCIECDKLCNLLDWRGLCDRCAEKEDKEEEDAKEKMRFC